MATTVKQSNRAHWQQVPATWETYLGLLRDRGERSRPRYAFYDGRLTIVSPGAAHESLKKRLAGLIEEVLVGLRLPCLMFGETTYLKEREPRAGKEPDESYYLTRLDLVRGKERIIMGVDPPPDLVVEVVATNPLGDTLKIYQRFGVREVWVCKRSELVFLVLGADGRYARSEASAALPFLSAAELTPWVYRHDLPDDTELRHRFRAWVAETLGPRRRGD